jgi:RNA polymerase sigma-70 factor (ECF subfamily)
MSAVSTHRSPHRSKEAVTISQSQSALDLRETQHQAGRPLCFADVFCEYQRPIYNYLLRMVQNRAEAEDLTQETFIRVHRSLSTFRGEASLSTWIYRIATNVSHDHFRRRATQQARATLLLEGTESEEEWIADEAAPSPEQLAAQSEMSTCVQRFIQRLSPDYRAVPILSDLQGLKNHEIAEVLNVSLSTVKIRLHRARARLREVLDAGCSFAHDERNVFVCEPRVGAEETEEGYTRYQQSSFSDGQTMACSAHRGTPGARMRSTALYLSQAGKT